MPTDRIVTISASGSLTGGGIADYADFGTLEITERGNLVTLDRRLIIEIDKDGGHVAGTSVAFNSSVWTTDATRYILIRARVGSEHNGTDNGGATLEQFGGNGTRLSNIACVIVVEDIILMLGGSVNFSTGIAGSNACTLLVQRCVFVHSSSNSSNTLMRCTSNVSTGSIIVRNCILYTTTGCENGILVAQKHASNTCLIDNNTVVGSFSLAGIDANLLTPTIRNNLVDNTGAGPDYLDTGSATTQTNASADATSPQGAGYQTITPIYVNAGAHDYHLAAAVGVAATDLSTAFTDDIDGDTRVTWDVGADYFAVASSVPRPRVLVW